VYPLESSEPSSGPRALSTSRRISDTHNKMKSSSVSPGPFTDSKAGIAKQSSSSTTQNTKSDFVSDKGTKGSIYQRRNVTTRRFTIESRVGSKRDASSLHASNQSNNQISSSASAAMSVKNYEPNDSPSLINVDKRFNIGPKGEYQGLLQKLR